MVVPFEGPILRLLLQLLQVCCQARVTSPTPVAGDGQCQLDLQHLISSPKNTRSCEAQVQHADSAAGAAARHSQRTQSSSLPSHQYRAGEWLPAPTHGFLRQVFNFFLLLLKVKPVLTSISHKLLKQSIVIRNSTLSTPTLSQGLCASSCHTQSTTLNFLNPLIFLLNPSFIYLLFHLQPILSYLLLFNCSSILSFLLFSNTCNYLKT